MAIIKKMMIESGVEFDCWKITKLEYDLEENILIVYGRTYLNRKAMLEGKEYLTTFKRNIPHNKDDKMSLKDAYDKLKTYNEFTDCTEEKDDELEKEGINE